MQVRRRKGILAAGLAVLTAATLSTIHMTEAGAAEVALRSGGYELVLTDGNVSRPVAVRDIASGATVLAEAQPLQLILKNGSSPVDAGAKYSAVRSESGALIATGEVRSPAGSVFRFEDRYEAAPEGGFAVDRSVTVISANPADQGFNSRFTIGPTNPRPLADYQFLAPGVWYDRNANVPPGALASDYGDDYFYFREMRMPLPFVMMHDTASGLDVSIAHEHPQTDSDVDESSSAWLVDGDTTHAALGAQKIPSTKVAIVYPAMEGEKNYVNRGADWVRRSSPVTPGYTQHYEFRINVDSTGSFAAAVHESWRYHWNMAAPQVQKVPVQTVYDASIAVLASYVQDYNGVPGLPFSVWLPNGEVNEVSFQMGFVGQQIPAGYLLLREGYDSGNTDYIDKGRRILDFWAQNSAAPSGLPRTWWDVTPGQWRSFYPTYLRIATDGMEGMLRAADLMRDRGTPVAQWDTYTKRFGDWLVANQNSDGSYYRAYNLEGTAPQHQGKYNTHNAVPFLLELAEYTGDTRYRDTALRAGEYAFQNVHLPAAYVGGTPDNDNVTDKEAALLALRSFMALYDHTGEQRWLDAAQQAADFGETWSYAWNYPVESTRPAYAQYGVRGQSLIATGHSAIDTWQSGSLYDYYRLYEATGDDHYLEHARLIANESKLTTQWPGNPLGYARDGLLEEAIGLADLRYGGVNLWLPWNSVAHAEPLAHLEDAYGTMDIDQIGAEPAGGRQIRNRHSNLCLDDFNWITTPGAEVRQWTCNGQANQDWHLTDLGNGYHSISNGHSGLCLDDYNWATTPGAEVRQWTCTNSAAQQWRTT
ncbi:RICIN domain-containing protein [Glycomyces algeriensis]|uniref:RICIN domain-containing protein n=1 Tax=Glycomyces algeriensis TaxID=256037 RepID=UPI0022D88693|nr:RICIN domain-containing protein [Glycomyces algeriensis]MDA1365714.1 RICIN domain-containing protein [Glycomyces algeriensis]